MNLSSLGDTLRDRFSQLSVRLRPPAEMITQLREEAQAVQDSVNVSLKEQAERPTVYDRQAVVSSSPGRDAKLRALDKVAELKARVRMLKSRIAGASGPLLKRLARQLGQIAAQLKQAVSLYTGASARSAASLTGNASASLPAGPQAASGASASTASASAGMDAAGMGSRDGADHVHAGGDSTREASADAVSDTQDTASQAKEAGSDGDEKLDKLFAREVRSLVEEIRRAAALLRQKADKDSRDALNELDRVLAEIQNMLAQLNQSSQGQTTGSAGEAGAVASVVAGALGGAASISGVSVDSCVAASAVAGVGDVSVGSVAVAGSPGGQGV